VRLLRRWGVRFLGLLLVLCACSPRIEQRAADVELRAAEDGSCQPARSLTEVIVEALGDFPASDARTIEVFRPGAEEAAIDRFPAETLALAVRARAPGWEGIAARLLPSGDSMGPLLVLPEDRSCALADPAVDGRGSALALPGGALLVWGGVEGELGSRRAIRLEPGEQLATSLAPSLAVRRVGARAVLGQDAAYLLGGAQGITGPAHDTYETYDLSTGELTGELGQLQVPRRDMGATMLPDGRILLAGGRSSAEGPPLDSVELVDPVSGESTLLEPLPNARAHSTLLTLDDGAVILVGGFGTGGGYLIGVLTFDPGARRFVETGETVLLRDDARVAVLPGGRALVLGDAQEGRSSSLMSLIRRVPPDLGGPPPVEIDTVDLGDALPELTRVAAVALADGRVLLTGVDDRADPRAFLVGRDFVSVEERDASRLPLALVRLADGLVAELGEAGTSLRRTALRTAFDSPPATLFAEDLALDGQDRWNLDGADLVARVDGARADLVALRFGDFELRLEAEGMLDVLLRPNLASPIRVAVEDDLVGPALCELPRIAGHEVVLERRGRDLTISTSGTTRRCALDGLGERVGVAFRARRAGTRVRGVMLRRLAD